MKTFTKYPRALRYIYLPILTILCVAAVLIPTIVKNLFFFNGIFLIALLLILLLPTKRYQKTITSQASEHYGFFSYLMAFGKLSLMQLVLIFIDVNINLIFTKLLPATQQHKFNALLPLDIQHFFYWGYFPWALILLMGFILATRQTQKNPSPTFMNLIAPVVGVKRSRIINIGAELFIRQSLIISAGILTIAFGFSLYFYAAAMGAPTFSFEPNGYTVFIYLLVFVIFSSRFWTRVLRKLWLNNYSTLQLMLLQAGVAIILILLLTPCIHIFGQLVQLDLHKTIVFPRPHLDLSYAWTLFNGSFWLSSVIFLAPLIAHIAKGKNLKIMILLGLFWPVIFTLLLLSSKFQLHLVAIMSILDATSISLILNILMLLLIAIGFIRNRSFDALMLQYFYPENAHLQKHYPVKMLTGYLRLVSLLLLLYMFNGINLLSILMFGLIACCFIVYAVATVGFFKGLLFSSK